ncbi:MAG: hypothetical protein MHM6MM_004984, partial [Cercozoa sp. M6MM]
TDLCPGYLQIPAGRRSSTDNVKNRVAVLVTGPCSEYQQAKWRGGYGARFADFYGEDSDHWLAFDCYAGDIPTAQELVEDYGVGTVFVTGSKFDAHDDVKYPWLVPLQETLHSLSFDSRDHSVRIVGVCFGHQLMARVLGGHTGRSDVGWCLGPQKIRLLPEFQQHWAPLDAEITLQQMHRDAVSALPPQATLLATSDFCTNEIFSWHGPSAKILCVQSHPEFENDEVKARLQGLYEDGLMSDAEFARANEWFDTYKQGQSAAGAAKVDPVTQALRDFAHWRADLPTPE